MAVTESQPALTPTPAVGRSPAATAAIVVALIGLYLLTQYPHAFRGAFAGDDYVFIEKTSVTGFPKLILPEALPFHYYRPISRELHFWVLLKAFGLRELPFHVASVVLTLSASGLYFLLVRAIAGTAVAGVAIATMLALSSWGVLVVWASGSQDLWMFNFAFGSLLCLVHGRRVAAVALFVMALLSKETAALLPGVAVAYYVAIERLRLREALARTAGFWVVAAVWASFHPMLGGQLVRPLHDPVLPGLHQPLSEIVGRTLLATVNLDERPLPIRGWQAVLPAGMVAVIVLGGLIRLCAGSLAWRSPEAASPAPRATPQRIAAFGVCWAVLAWCPLLLPSLGWHAYYALLGMHGAWLALAVGLSRRPALAMTVIAALAIMRAGRAETKSTDWGNEWFQRRAADFGLYSRNYFRTHYPDVPSHSRFFLAKIPPHVGLVPGGEQSPAMRVWYGDSTLQTYFASKYRQVSQRLTRGRDYIFTYEDNAGWQENAIVELPDDPSPTERDAYAQFRWKVSDFATAREQYELLVAMNPQRWEYAFNLGSCILQQGDSATAARWYQRAAALPGVPEGIRRTAERSRRFLTK